MSNVRVFVGLDYHDDEIQVCVVSDDEKGTVLCNRKVPNDAAAVVALASRHGQVQAAALEACCGAANLAQELRNKGWSVSLAHAGFVARMKQNPDKTDYGDARMLADLLRVGYLPKVWLAPERLRRLRRLVRYRQQLVDQRRDVKLRIRAVLRENRLKHPGGASAWTKGWLTWVSKDAALEVEDRWIMDQHLAMLSDLDGRVKACEQELERWAKDDAVVKKLRTFAGVGLITSMTLRAEIGEFDRFRSGKQLSRYCGVTPQNASSGNRQSDAGLVRAGNPSLRRVLVEFGHRLVRSGDARWRGLCGGLMRRGKHKNVAVAAVVNRWVRWLCHQMQPEQLAV